MVQLKKLKPSTVVSGILSSFETKPLNKPISTKVQKGAQRQLIGAFQGQSASFQALGFKPPKAMGMAKKKKKPTKFVKIGKQRFKLTKV